MSHRLKKAIKELSKTNDEKYCLVCTVDSVDETALTAYCLPIDEQKADLPDVRLVANTSKIGLVRFPKVGSIVIVSFLSNEAGYISDCNDIDKIYLNGSGYGGIVQVQPLVNKLNALEDWVNKFTLIFNALTLPVSGSTAGPPPTPLTDIFIDTTKTELENTTVKHGTGN